MKKDMKRILLSLLTIVAVFSIALVGSQAFFSDTETSEGNTLAAGALDLQIDNKCYYNGNACVNRFWEGTQEPCDCTWNLKNLEEGDAFFQFKDLKPGDYEEDTISLHVFDNNAWACVKFAANDDLDVTCTDPEIEAGDPECLVVLPGDPPVPDTNGELDNELQFIFWEDDGDNVLEEGERLLSELATAFLTGGKVTIADSLGSIFTPSNLTEGGALIGSKNYFIGKAFCYGDLTPAPLAPGVYTPAGDNDGNEIPGEPTDGGFKCYGKPVGNISQTDLLTGDAVFYAEQERHNPDFECNPE